MIFFSNKDSTFDNNLYNKILLLSRNKFFYKDAELADTYQIRIRLIFFHISFLINIIQSKDNSDNTKKIMQRVFDSFFKRIEQDMREQGFGDVTINKNMKLLVNLFYNILIDFKNFDELDQKNKINLFVKFTHLANDAKKPKLIELVNYFEKYKTFCFDLSLNSVIKGDFNFKY